MIRVGDALGTYVRSLRLSNTAFGSYPEGSVVVEEEDEGEDKDLSGRHDVNEEKEDDGQETE